MVTFELIAMHSVPLGIVRRNNSLEFIVEGYENIKEVVFYTWKTFLDQFQPTSDSNQQSQPPGKWKWGKHSDFIIWTKSINLVCLYTFLGIHTNGILHIIVMDQE
jgi:hypothetical protein